MSDDLIECPVCDGLGYHPCDDGAEMQCTRCDGTGKVAVVQADEWIPRRLDDVGDHAGPS